LLFQLDCPLGEKLQRRKLENQPKKEKRFEKKTEVRKDGKEKKADQAGEVGVQREISIGENQRGDSLCCLLVRRDREVGGNGRR
jgi:hypothetical protein